MKKIPFQILLLASITLVMGCFSAQIPSEEQIDEADAGVLSVTIDSGAYRCSNSGADNPRWIDTATDLPNVHVEGEAVVIDQQTGLSWQGEKHNTGLYHPQAITHCNNLEYAGSTNWILPSKEQLTSLLRNNGQGPGSDFPCIAGRAYWTSTESDSGPLRAWSVHMSANTAWISLSNSAVELRVMCVQQ